MAGWPALRRPPFSTGRGARGGAWVVSTACDCWDVETVTRAFRHRVVDAVQGANSHQRRRCGSAHLLAFELRSDLPCRLCGSGSGGGSQARQAGIGSPCRRLCRAGQLACCAAWLAITWPSLHSFCALEPPRSSCPATSDLTCRPSNGRPPLCPWLSLAALPQRLKRPSAVASPPPPLWPCAVAQDLSCW